MKTRVPAVAGWLNIDPAHPRLIGTKCTKCGSIFFPRETVRCRNPRCGHNELAETELSPKGTLWSYTGAEYQPPAPYVPRHDPFKPFAIAAVDGFDCGRITEVADLHLVKAHRFDNAGIVGREERLDVETGLLVEVIEHHLFVLVSDQHVSNSGSIFNHLSGDSLRALPFRLRP